MTQLEPFNLEDGFRVDLWIWHITLARSGGRSPSGGRSGARFPSFPSSLPSGRSVGRTDGRVSMSNTVRNTVTHHDLTLSATRKAQRVIIRGMKSRTLRAAFLL